MRSGQQCIPRRQLDARPALELSARALDCVDPPPAGFVDHLDAALGQQRVDRLTRRCAASAAAPPARRPGASTVSAASFLFVPMIPLGPRLIHPVQ